jgi:hypothetical protein
MEHSRKAGVLFRHVFQAHRVKSAINGSVSGLPILVQEDPIAIRVFEQCACAVRADVTFAEEIRAQPLEALILTDATLGAEAEAWMRP